MKQQLNVYNIFQTEALKRICLLKWCISEKFQDLINKALSDNQDILTSNYLDVYYKLANYKDKVNYLILNCIQNIQKLFSSDKTNANIDLDFMIKKVQDKLKEDKLYVYI